MCTHVRKKVLAIETQKLCILLVLKKSTLSPHSFTTALPLGGY